MSSEHRVAGLQGLQLFLFLGHELNQVFAVLFLLGNEAFEVGDCLFEGLNLKLLGVLALADHHSGDF